MVLNCRCPFNTKSYIFLQRMIHDTLFLEPLEKINIKEGKYNLTQHQT